MVSDGRPPAFFKSCTCILVTRERDKGSLGVKLLIKNVGFGIGIRTEYVVLFKRWCALLITTRVFQKGESFFVVASVFRIIEA